MSNIEANTIQVFCEHCDWAHQCWLMRKYLFDENPEEKLLKLPEHAHFFTRLAKILQEYWILEVVKLHDPPKQFGSANLSVEYIYSHGEWTPEAQEKLERLKDKMNGFISAIRPARHKLLSHKDKDTIVAGKVLGAFQEGDDIAYFEALREFANEVHMDVVGSPFLFDDLTQNDIDVFMSTFSKGVS